MEEVQAIIVERETHATALMLFKQAIKKGHYKPKEFSKFIEDVMHYGLTMEALIQSKRVDKDVFENVTEIVVTSKKKMFSET